MKPADFALWSSGSSPEQLAKALAILGAQQAVEMESDDPNWSNLDRITKVLEQAEAIPTEPLRCNYVFGRWNRLRAPSPLVLANVWDHFRLRHLRRDPLRIQVVAPEQVRGPYDTAWILNQLRLPAVGAESAFVGIQPTATYVAWRYPVRVGMLTDTMLDAYRQAANSSYGVRHLTRRIDLLTSRGPVDLLVLDADLSKALRSIAGLPYPIHAHMVAILGGEGGLSWPEIEQAKARITELTLAQAVVITRQDSSTWIHTFIRELSHDEMIDVAVNRSGGNILPVSGPVLFASDPVLKNSRVSHFASAMVNQGFARYHPDTSLSLEDLPAKRLGLKTGPERLGVVLERLKERIEDIGWIHERDGASVIASVNKSLEAGMAGKLLPPKSTSIFLSVHEPPPQVPRHLQIAVFAQSTPKKFLRVTDAFMAGRKHLLKVHIGPRSDDLLVLHEALSKEEFIEFPEKDLPPNDDGGHLLTIVFFEPQFMKQPQLKTTFLPKVGPAHPCRFEFRVSRKANTVEGRVTVLYENRVLQTGIVRGPVSTSAASTTRGVTSEESEHAAQIDFVLSGVVGRASADLSARSRFDAALVINDLGGGHGIHSVSGTDARYIPVSDKTTSDAVEKINHSLEVGLWELREFNNLYASETADLVRTLARFGNRIFAFLEKHLSPSVLTAKKLQVVIAHRDARFPVEFIYSFNAPARNAPICPHAAQALLTGQCAQDCAAGRRCRLQSFVRSASGDSAE